jgi:hypothetical protein
MLAEGPARGGAIRVVSLSDELGAMGPNEESGLLALLHLTHPPPLILPGAIDRWW